MWFTSSRTSGKEDVAWIERFGEVESIGKRTFCSTTICYYFTMHANLRKIRMSEENESFQRQLQQNREKELDKLQAAKTTTSKTCGVCTLHIGETHASLA
ncbi:hypothetical protein MTR_3g096558 [Medicago truncatula]|uniref:Uncharacterized protein n=1 Tax=Medicago truncatula TaxID=3880 RepID=A0A072V0Q1_MEDTR|nr:hypothetical protein MTR_3g096558 [Medicago truncatula]